MIPQQLHNRDFRYILVDEEKRPVEKKWTTTNNYVYDDPVLLTYLKKGYNYGVLGGYGNLIIIDFDKEWIQNEAYPLLPPTFTIKTARKGMYHLYYIIEGGNIPKKAKIPDVPSGEAGDILGIGAQAVAPNSKVVIKTPNSSTKTYGTYTILRDIPIATTTIKAINDILQQCINARQKLLNEPITTIDITKDTAPTTTTPTKPLENNANKSYTIDFIKKINLKEFLDKQGLVHFHKGLSNNAECPFHPSENKQNLSINQADDGSWVCYCHHNGCDFRGDIFNFFMKKYSCTFDEALKIITNKLLKDPAFTNAVLPNDTLSFDEKFVAAIKPTITLLIISKQHKEAIKKLADFIIQHYHIKTIKNDTTQELWYYDNTEGIYKENGIAQIKELTNKVLDINYTKLIVQAIVERIVAQTYIVAEDFFKQHENYTNIIAVKNGLLDLTTTTLNPFTPKQYHFSKLPVTYDATKICPKILKFIHEIVPIEENVETIKELFGYILLRDYPINKAFLFYGNGRNGKSQLFRLITEFVGINNTASINLHQIELDTFALTTFHNKLVNISSEISKKTISETSVFKRLVGQDSLTANRKFKTPIHFTNYAKLLFAANELPTINNDDDAFWRRWIIIKLPYQFLDKSDIDTKTDEEKKLVKPQILDVVNTLIDADEMSGLLNWAIEGYHQLIKNNKFTYNKGLDAIKEEWYMNTSNSYVFIHTHIIAASEDDDTIYISVNKLKIAYMNWCKNNKLKPDIPQKFNAILRNTTPATIAHKRIDGIFTKIWDNIKLK